MDHIIIDGDICVYAVANGSDGHARKECAARGEEFKPEPVSYVLHSLKLMLDSIISDYNEYTVYLSSTDKSDNFRYDRYPQYKSNRPETKPTHLAAARHYLETYYNARIAHGEADDAMAADLNKAWDEAVETAKFFGDEDFPFHYLPTVLATVDKDLRMVPGRHYNWRKAEAGVVNVTPDEGWRNFVEQLLTGDAVDSIPGLKRVGPKTAAKILDEVPMTRVDSLRAVIEAYGSRGESISMMLRNADLLWMRVDNRYGSDVLNEVINSVEQGSIWKAAADAALEPKPKRGGKSCKKTTTKT